MHKFCFFGLLSPLCFQFYPAMYQMLVTVNGQPQMSFEQFQVTFREAFGRDMTPDERRWFGPAFLQSDFKPSFLDGAA